MSYNKDTNMYEGYIYQIYNDVNDKLYIGQTITTIKDRWCSHLRAMNKCDYNIYKAMRKYGVDHFYIFEVEKIVALTKDALLIMLNDKEKYWIAFYDSYYNGYNQTFGGQDDPPNKYTEVSVIEYSIDGIELCTYNSIADAADKTGFNHSDIVACCQRIKMHRVKNRIFRYKDSPLTKEEITFYKKKYPKIMQYDVFGNLLHTYEFMSDAAKNTGVNSANISACTLGKTLTAGGYVWRKFPDVFLTYRTPNIKRIEQRDVVNGSIICIYDNFDEVRMIFGENATKNIIHCCNGHCHSSCGYHWCFQGRYDPNDLKKVHEIMVNQYDLLGNYLATYQSFQKAAKAIFAYSESASSSIGVAAKTGKSAYGYLWKCCYDCI